MFNPAPQRAAPPAWAPDTVLQPVRQREAGFANTDWDDVPRLDYRTEKFRQLAVPDPARVVDDASEFEPWQPRQLGEASFSVDATTAKSASVESGSGKHEVAKTATQGQGGDSAVHAAEDSSEASHQGSSGETDDSTETQAHTDAPTAANDAQQAQASDALNADAMTDDATAADIDHSAAEAGQDAGDADMQAVDTAGDSDTSDATPDSAEPALDSAAVQEACEAARQEGLDQGREEGLTQGREQALEEVRQEREAALEQAAADKAQALQQLREELEGEFEPLKRQLNKAAEQVQSLAGQPNKLYEHIKRLSLHLAEQLVLGELNMSSAAIERLIQRCLDELNLHGNHVVTVELNPQDKARLQERAGEMSHALSVQAVASLQPGSVRVMINDTLVEDLVENRLEALARTLLVQPEVWREQSPFFRQPLAQRDAEVQDAPARVVAPREATPATSAKDHEDDHTAEQADDHVNDQMDEASSERSGEPSREPPRHDASDATSPLVSPEGQHD